MKILFVNKFFFLNGGSETVFFQEREFLTNNGHEVIDFSMKHPDNLPSSYADYFVPNVAYHEEKDPMSVRLKTALQFIHNNEAISRLSKLLLTEKPHIAHLHNIYHQITPAIIPLLKKNGIKIVLTLHDYKLLCPSYYMLSKDSVCNKCAGRHFYHAAFQRCREGSFAKSMLLAVEAYWQKFFRNYEMVDLFIAPSRFMADTMARYCVDEKKIVVLPNGIDTAKYSTSDIDHDYILYFGRISKVKGIDTLLKAYRDLKITMPLKIVGTGPEKERLQLHCQEVEFTGYHSGVELEQLIAGASFAVVPSEWYENCPMSVLEAMAYGKVVIGSNIGGIPEQIEDGESGLLFNPADAGDLGIKMLHLVQDKALRRQMGARGRQIIENKYSLKEHCDKLTDIYKRLIG